MALSAGLRLAKFKAAAFARKQKRGFFKVAGGTVKRQVKRSYIRGKGQIKRTLTTGEPFKTMGKEAVRHAGFYKKIISPQGKQFKYLLSRPTFGETKRFHPNLLKFSKGQTHYKVATKGKKIRNKLIKGGLIGGYGAYTMKS